MLCEDTYIAKMLMESNYYFLILLLCLRICFLCVPFSSSITWYIQLSTLRYRGVVRGERTGGYLLFNWTVATVPREWGVGGGLKTGGWGGEDSLIISQVLSETIFHKKHYLSYTVFQGTSR